MSLFRVPCAVAMFMLLPACIYDGSYVIRGTLLGQTAGIPSPVDGASVVVKRRDGKAADGPPAHVSSEGTFVSSYRFGGMGFLFFAPGDGDPRVEFAAPGYRTCSARLRGDSDPVCAIRRSCSPPERACFVLDAVLVPEPDQGQGAANGTR